jgi:hypothetical protein
MPMPMPMLLVSEPQYGDVYENGETLVLSFFVG